MAPGAAAPARDPVDRGQLPERPVSQLSEAVANPGLTGEEVGERRARGLGNEETPSTSRTFSQIVAANVLTRFNAILAVLLGVIIVVGPFQDGLFGVVLVLNTLIGILQEVRAKRTLDRLALVSAPHARVRRDGGVSELGLRELVVDDVVELRPGDQVPLDGTVVEEGMEIDESLLSGEADPVAKPSGSVVLSGSFVSSGSGLIRITAVGAESYAQKLAAEAREFSLARSELRDGINRILQLVQWLLVPVAALLVTSQLVAHRDLPDAIRGCVAGVGAMIPEGLVLLTSVAFAVAVIRLARRRVLVQELAAVEGLARVDVLCIDKTGTLTQGGIVAERFEPIGTGQEDAVAALGALAAAEHVPNPTLMAIGHRWPAPDWTGRATVPFSSGRRWSAVDFGERGTWVLGAPEVVLGACQGNGDEAAARVAELAAEGRRVVVVAVTHDAASVPLTEAALPPGLQPAGIVSLVERVRDDAAATVAYFQSQGVSLRVISGDHPATVAAIAAVVGIEGADQPVDAAPLGDDELAALVEHRTVFGRVGPRQKRAMVAALQRQGHVVAMTGDGVNDVLALKDADVGVAMGSGSSATRGVAQLVLLDDTFASLPPVIAEGRRVIANVERVANLFLVKTVYATVVAIVVGLTGVPYLFLPRHLTIVSTVTIGAPAFVLALLANDRPFQPGFVRRVLHFAVPCGAIAGSAALAAFFLAYQADVLLDQARTTATMTLVLSGLWVLGVLARPFTTAKGALVVAMIATFGVILASGRARTYFALRLPPAAQTLEALLLAAAASGGIEAAYRWQRRRAGLGPDPEAG
ncbi:MAG: HAD-IC family P-type ATPase [Acidimicrobiales bacterium]